MLVLFLALGASGGYGYYTYILDDENPETVDTVIVDDWNDILNSDFELIKTLNLDILLTPSRNNGVFFMLKAIKKYAEAFSKT